MEVSNIFSKSNKGIFGFDLGTTNSVVTTYNSKGMPVIINSGYGDIVPSCIQFNSDGTYEIGRSAYKNKSLPNVAYSFKKFMGSPNLIDIYVECKKKQFLARELSELFIRKLFDSLYENNPQYKGINNIIISVPAYFNVHQVSDTKLAFTNLGFNVIRVQIEPISASFVYQQVKRIIDPIVVFDLGGGTFDAVLIKNELGFPDDSLALYAKEGISFPPVSDYLEVVDITGDNLLGGDNIDEFTVKEFFRRNNIKGKVTRSLLLDAEFVKKYQDSREIDISGNKYIMIYDDVVVGTGKVLEKCLTLTFNLLKRNNIDKAHCVLCGGSTKSKLIQDKLKESFSISSEIDADLAVGIGNSLTASTLKELKLLSRTAKYIGIIQDSKFTSIINKGDILPVRRVIQTTNSIPYAKEVRVDFYQTEDIMGKLDKVSTLILTDLMGFDDTGQVIIDIEVSITLDAIVLVSAEVDGKKLTSTFGLSQDVGDSSLDLSKEYKWYRRFKKFIEDNNLIDLTDMLEEFRLTKNMTLGKEIHKRIEIWRINNE